jgi:hypothetical protein
MVVFAARGFHVLAPNLRRHGPTALASDSNGINKLLGRILSAELRRMDHGVASERRRLDGGDGGAGRANRVAGERRRAGRARGGRK